MNTTEKFKVIKDYLEKEIADWKATDKQQFGNIDLNTSLTISGRIGGLQIAENFMKTNEHNNENWHKLISKVNTEIEKTQDTMNREIDIEGKNYLSGQIQGLRNVKIQIQILEEK